MPAATRVPTYPQPVHQQQRDGEQGADTKQADTRLQHTEKALNADAAKHPNVVHGATEAAPGPQPRTGCIPLPLCACGCNGAAGGVGLPRFDRVCGAGAGLIATRSGSGAGATTLPALRLADTPGPTLHAAVGAWVWYGNPGQRQALTDVWDGYWPPAVWRW